ncbi:class I SAM-dependent methyltransferase [Phycisphaerales bacterium AB-hyl4]|uniref:Class I SAM-dependent methyltransferase n=1 Tax=Natronomicrosphaera hydrolytica TaxID=3242702 RepID=A0ABV4U6S5_9BACT
MSVDSAHESQAVWRGVRFPDSDLVSLICKHLPSEHRRGGAVVVGCGNGRHVRLLGELGFDAQGIDVDPQMIADAQANGVRAVHGRLEDYVSDQPINLLVAWGVVMIADIDEPTRQLARLDARYVVINWRTPENTFALQAKSRGDWHDEAPGVARCRIADGVSEHLQGLTYRVHDATACQLPGYDRLALRTVTITSDGETNAWHQTVHRRR